MYHWRKRVFSLVFNFFGTVARVHFLPFADRTFWRGTVRCGGYIPGTFHCLVGYHFHAARSAAKKNTTKTRVGGWVGTHLTNTKKKYRGWVGG